MPIDRQIEQVFANRGTALEGGSTAVPMAAVADVPPPAVAAITQQVIETTPCALVARCYYPLAGTSGAAAKGGPTLLPALLYLPGEGAPADRRDAHDTLCRRLANACRALVVVPVREGRGQQAGEGADVSTVAADDSHLDARLDDVLAAVRWTRAHAADLAIDPRRVAIAGDDVGAYLAARALIDLRDAGDPPLVMQVLISPVLDLIALDAFIEHGDGADSARDESGRIGLQVPGAAGASPRSVTSMPAWLAESAARPAIERHLLSVTRRLRGWRDTTVADAAGLDDRALSPLHASSLVGLPPAFVVSAGADPLQGQAQRWVERLHAAGIEAVHECFDGMVHGFVFMGPEVAGASHAAARMAQHLRPALRHRFT
jgi:acetyl esterase